MGSQDEDMVRSEATTPEQYLAELPEDRRDLVETIRRTILDNLPDGYEETMTFGMLGYVVPLELFPDTYNGEPVGAVALANQKRHVAVYLMGVYGDEAERRWFVDAWAATGRKLDDVALDVLGAAVARVPPEQIIAIHDRAHGQR